MGIMEVMIKIARQHVVGSQKSLNWLVSWQEMCASCNVEHACSDTGGKNNSHHYAPFENVKTLYHQD